VQKSASRRMKGIVGLAAITVLLFPIQNSASAHPTTSFNACTVHIPGMCISRGATHNYGDTILIKGRVKPAHSRLMANVLRRRPHGHIWIKVASVNISDLGRMHFAWKTHLSDAVQDAPYLFEFRIPGHGTSNKTEAYVIAGE
jgi:hypothetical protein